MKLFAFPLFFGVFLFFVACLGKSSRLLLPEMSEVEKQLIDLLSSEKIAGIKYHHASLKNGDIVVVLSYPEWSRKKIQLLGQAVTHSAPLIFSANQSIQKVTFYAVNGSKDYTKKHFIGLARALWEDPPVILSGHDNPLMAYEIAETYYVGPKVSGNLNFRKENQEIILPPQKPMA